MKFPLYMFFLICHANLYLKCIESNNIHKYNTLGPKGLLVVVAQLRYVNGFFCDFINDSVLIVDSSGPVAGKSVLQRLGLSSALKRSAYDLFY